MPPSQMVPLPDVIRREQDNRSVPRRRDERATLSRRESPMRTNPVQVVTVPQHADSCHSNRRLLSSQMWRPSSNEPSHLMELANQRSHQRLHLDRLMWLLQLASKHRERLAISGHRQLPSAIKESHRRCASDRCPGRREAGRGAVSLRHPSPIISQRGTQRSSVLQDPPASYSANRAACRKFAGSPPDFATAGTPADAASRHASVCRIVAAASYHASRPRFACGRGGTFAIK